MTTFLLTVLVPAAHLPLWLGWTLLAAGTGALIALAVEEATR